MWRVPITVLERFAKPSAKTLTGSIPVPAAKTEGTAEWSATGLENRGMVTHGGSIPLPSAITIKIRGYS